MTVNVTISQARQGKLVEHSTYTYKNEQEAEKASEIWWRMNIITEDKWLDELYWSQDERKEFDGLVWSQR